MRGWPPFNPASHNTRQCAGGHRLLRGFFFLVFAGGPFAEDDGEALARRARSACSRDWQLIFSVVASGTSSSQAASSLA